MVMGIRMTHATEKNGDSGKVPNSREFRAVLPDSEPRNLRKSLEMK